ncbi:hypothetical protein HYN59_04430 [Flavobacterium album]|uniref:T9SS sorting signal type C domain-containing protein n=1 Tax=Flavobacterium album TaxID=2175091 RepID=A0A2S1QVF9_9FLAO|nr:T9SS sorting signal type C domain-containing protein [Flavobacterium album]AWH84407.1 hypothetical protein HYN59_04430 [Flavobacterium album]
MKHNYFNCCKTATMLFAVFLSSQAFAQVPTSHDEASNYAEGEFTYGAGKGMGFVPWQLQGASDTSGFSLGSSTAVNMGDVNTDGQAFYLYGYNDEGVKAARYFRGTGSVSDPGDSRSFLLPGQVFSIKIAIANRNGYKGINITSDDGSDRLATFAVDGNTYRFGDPDDDSFTGVNDAFSFDTESVFIVEAYQLTDNTCEITLTRGDVSISTGIKAGQIGGFSLYTGSTTSDDPLNRLYFNNLKIERRCPDFTTWNGATWDNGTPDITKQAYVTAGTLTVDEDMEMCTLFVSGTAQVIVESGVNLTVANQVNVASTAAMSVANNANLMQIDNVQNTGNITVFRNSSALKRLDYTLWSSPVTGQNLFGFSPQTLPNRFYTYNPVSNMYSPIPDLGPTSEMLFTKGHGYMIRMPNNHPDTPTVWQGKFTGIPNSGTVSVPLNTSNDPANRYTLVGNPYPASLSIARFINRNANIITGQVWFWRKTNNPASSSYCTVTASGDYVGNPDLQNNESYDPNGIIRTGQGFFVQASSASPSTLIFNNSLREADNSNKFFRTAMDGEVMQPEINRYWLNVTKDGEFFGQMLVNYRTGATMGIDYGIDGEAMDGDGALGLYSTAGDSKLAIQGRSLPFVMEDIVPLGFRANEAGTVSIVLDRFDGLFNEQDIYIKDNLLGITHNIKNGPYEFTTEAGTFTNRFEVVYAETLSTTNPVFNANSVIVYKQGSSIAINSGNVNMAAVTVYDMRGRVLYQQEGINSTETAITGLQAQQQVLIVQVTTTEGNKVSKKIAY